MSDYAAYISAAVAGVVCFLATRWIWGRFQSRAKRSIFGVLAALICLTIYFLAGAVITLIRPGQAHDIGVAMVQHMKMLVLVLIAANAVAYSLKPST